MDVKDNSDLRNYVNCDFITLDEGFATYTSFKKMFRLAGIEPKAITTVSDIFSILNLVQAGIYISLIPSRVKSFYEKNIQFIKLAKSYQAKQSISIVYLHQRQHDKDLLALAAEGRVYARELNK